MTVISSQLTRNMDQFIRHQVDQYFTKTLRQKKQTKPIITISREFGCEGLIVASKLAEELKKLDSNDWLIYNRKLIEKVTEKEEFEKDLMESLDEQQRNQVEQFADHLLAHKPGNYSLYQKMAQSVKALSNQGHCIIVGSGGAILTEGLPHSLHIRLKANPEFRINRISSLLSVSGEEAKQIIEKSADSRFQLIYNFTRKNVDNPKYYDLIIDNARFSSDQIVGLIIHALNDLVPDWKNE